MASICAEREVRTPSATAFMLLMICSSVSPLPSRRPTVLLRLRSPGRVISCVSQSVTQSTNQFQQVSLQHITGLEGTSVMQIKMCITLTLLEDSWASMTPQPWLAGRSQMAPGLWKARYTQTWHTEPAPNKLQDPQSSRGTRWGCSVPGRDPPPGAESACPSCALATQHAY